jgi:cation diffusion facilitator family transporter
MAAPRPALTRFAWMSIFVSIVIICLKGAAYALTGSVGLLSDALESLVNLAAASVALIVLAVVARPPDEDHPYGHDKAEYFSSGVEGSLILIAALAIAGAAIERLMHPRPLEQLGLGLALTLFASLINLAAARRLLTASRQYDSITLEADARHLMSDVWTSAGVLLGVGAVAVTGWLWLDPVVALVVAAQIVWMGFNLIRRSVQGLMDAALPAEEQAIIREVLDRYHSKGTEYHALRTRRSGARRFVSLHILVPGAWSVRQAHDLSEDIEAEVRQHLPNTTIETHLEPIEDPRAWRDEKLAPLEIPPGEHAPPS